MPQAFLDTGHERLLIACLDIDDPVRTQTGLAQGRSEQIRARDAPQDRAWKAGDDTGCKQGCRSAADRVVAPAGDLVQRAERQAARRQRRIEFGDAERQDIDRPAFGMLEGADLRAQGFKVGRAGGHHGRAPFRRSKCS